MKIILNNQEAREYLAWKQGAKTPVSTLVDCDTDPFVPEGWTLESHTKMGMVDPKNIRLHLEPEQEKRVIDGEKLEKRLETLNPLNANVLDYLLAHPELIPESWKKHSVYFWGTKYRNSTSDRVVRCLYWSVGQRNWSYRWIDYDFGARNPAAILAS